MEAARVDFLTLPAWFPADKAAAILRSQGKRLALIADRNGMTSVADRRQLAAAPASKSIAWCASPLGPPVSPTTSAAEARRLMQAHGSAYLPVVIGGVVVRIFALSENGGAGTGSPTEPADRIAA
jgi:hypothetical protein